MKPSSSEDVDVAPAPRLTLDDASIESMHESMQELMQSRRNHRPAKRSLKRMGDVHLHDLLLLL